MKVLVTNKRAKFDFELMESFEAGLVLTGTEIKSIRQASPKIENSFLTVSDSLEVFIHNMCIPHFSHGNLNNHEEFRKRKVLLNKNEIKKIYDRCRIDKLTLIVYSLYLKEGRAKIQINLAKGKRNYDKRETEKKKDFLKNLKKDNF
jgi:SsrA-binding protein